MRFIPTGGIREGMISANRLFGKNGELLLNAGATINFRYIQRLEEIDINGIYIEDNLSYDIGMSDLIKTELRHQTVRTVNKVFMVVEKGESLSKIYVNSINNLIYNIIENITQNNLLMLNLIDLRTFDYSTYHHSVLTPSEAMEYIMGGSGSLFDSEIVSAFVQKIAPYPVGVPVLISDNRKGIVVENYSDCCLRPKIKIIKHGIYDVEPYYLDLKNDRSTFGITVFGLADDAS